MIINIVGTDTEIGKTYITKEIIQFLKTKNKKALGFKPLATGLITHKDQKINEDVYNLYLANNKEIGINDINLITFEEPTAPHIMAEKNNYQLTTDSLKNQIIKDIIMPHKKTTDYCLIEGVGGILTPLNNQENYTDLLTALNLPVILVIGLKLGCLNHTLLTYEHLKQNNIKILGYIINKIDHNMLYQNENINYLTQKLPIKLLATCDFNKSITINKNFEDLFLC
jgi:dethiobiotin synthetase